MFLRKRTNRMAWALILMSVLQAATAAAKTVTVYTYEENHDQPTRIQIQDGSSNDLSDTTFGYDKLGRRTQVIRKGDSAADDHVALTVYNHSGSVALTVEKGPDNTTYTAIENGDSVTWNEYDKVGRLTLTKLTDGNPGATLRQTEYEYDDSGNVIKRRVLVEGGVYLDTVTEYDALNRAIKVTDPEGHYKENVYDSQNRLIVQTSYANADSNGLARQAWYYDNVGRLTKTARFADADSENAPATDTDRVVEYEYDDDGRVTMRTTYLVENGQATALNTVNEYDDIGRLTLTTDPAGNERETFYEAGTGLVFKREERDGAGDHNLVYWYDYDGVGRLTHETVSGESDLETWYEYDSLDRRTSVTDPEGVETTYAYDSLGRRVRVTENANTNGSRVTDSIYDRLGRLAKLVAYDGQAPANPDPEHAAAQTTTYHYDLAGRRTKIVYPDSIDDDDVVTFDYDLAGRMTTKTDQRGIVTRYAYDDRGLLTTKSVDTNGIEDVNRYEYDGLGRMTWANRGTWADPDAVSNLYLDYNDLSDLIASFQWSATYPVARILCYDYDPAGNRTMLYSSGITYLNYAYDDLNRVTRIDRNEETLAEYEYDGWLLTGRFVKTAAAVERWIEHHLVYDGDRRITHLVNQATAGGEETLLAGYGYEYDAVGNRTFTGGSGNTAARENITYGYDGLHRLTSANYETADGSESFNYDLLGNRTGDGVGTNGFGYSDTRAEGADVAYGANNEANEYSTIGGENVLHDAAGNLIRDEDGLGYGYDVENRLTQVFEDADSNGAYNQGVDTLLVEYNYDALGRRIEKIDHAGAEPVTTGYVYDGQNVLAEFNTNGTLQRYFVNGPTYIDERVLMHDATTGDEYYYLLKELYSIAGLANTNGELVEAYAYDAYGKVHVFASGAVCFDSDDDGDTDLADFADFQACFSGDGTPSTCAAALVNAFDSDGDADIDLTDLAALANCMDGPWSSLPANGDFNSNGVVDDADADAFDDCIENHSTNGTCLAAFDFDGSGEVDIYDAGVMAGLLGTFVNQPTHACLSQSTTSTVGNPYFFTGRRLDTLVHTNGVKQLQYNRVRYFNYDRWLQRDPLTYVDGANLYEYVRSNPTNAVDPLGLWHFKWPWEPKNDNKCQYTGKWEFTSDWGKAFDFIVSKGGSEFGAVAGHIGKERAGWTRDYRKIYKCKIGCVCVRVYGTTGKRGAITESKSWSVAAGVVLYPPEIPKGWLGKLLQQVIGGQVLLTHWVGTHKPQADQPAEGVNGDVYKESGLPPDTVTGKVTCKLQFPKHIHDIGG